MEIIMLTDEFVNRIKEIKTAELVNLLKQIDPGRDPWGASKLADELGRRKERKAVPRLLEMLARDGAQKRMSPIMRALGRIGDPSAVEPLIASLQQKGDASSDAAWALGFLGDKRAVSPLIEALGYSKKWIRVNAAEALGRLGDEKAIEPLKGLLSDDDEYFRKNVKNALVKLGVSDAPDVSEWILEEVDTSQEGQQLVDLKVVSPKNLERMGVRGVNRLVSSTNKRIDPATDLLVLKSAALSCGVCGAQFDLPNPLELGVLGSRDKTSVCECICPSCGSKNNLIGHTTGSSGVDQDCWVITTLISIPPKFQNSPYLGWPLLLPDKVFVKLRKQEAVNMSRGNKIIEERTASEESGETEPEQKRPWWKFWSK
jgi:hypothetical protein